MIEPRLSDAELLTILALSKDATAVYDSAELHIRFVNRAMLDIWGKGSSVIGMRFEDALPEMEGQTFTELLKNVWQTGVTYEARDTRADIVVDGRLQTFYFDFIYRAMQNESGQTYAILHTATNVDARMAAERLSAEKEHRLNQLILTSSAGMTILEGRDLIITIANVGILKLWGRNLEAVIGKKLLAVFPELIGQPFPEFLKRVFETGKPVASKEIAVRIVNEEGIEGIHYVDFAYEPLFDQQGIVEAIMVTVTDITGTVESRRSLEEREAELSTLNEEYQSTNEELSATNEQLYQISQDLDRANAILNSTNSLLRAENIALNATETKVLGLFSEAPVAIGLLTGRELVIESANYRMLQLWGKKAIVIGKPLAEALPELKGQPFLGILDDVYTRGVPFSGSEVKAAIEYNGKLTDRYFNFVYQPVKNEGGVTHAIMIVAYDVTEQVDARKHILAAEGRFAMMADNIAQLAWMADENGYIFWYNQRWYDYTGTNLKEMEGWGWQKVHHPDHVERVVKKISENFASGEPWEDLFPLRGTDGQYRWFLSRAVPARNENGKVISWFGTNTDVTEQRELEQKKDDFISIASHELKTPITTLKANLQLMDRLKTQINHPMIAQLVGSSNRSILKLNALVDDLLNVKRLDDGNLQLNKSKIKVENLLEQTCAHIRAEAKFELKIEADPGLEIFADEHRIDQVLVNLVNNAVKYAPDSKIIFLKAEKHADHIHFSVRDNGPGIPAEQLPKLFQRYWRAEHAGHKYSGLGLGLFICSEIIRRHNGQIGAESEPGKGSTFWFTLPLITN